MDINLLSKMLTELILRHDRVGLPGLGLFVAEEIGASFSDNGYTINPPYRRLSFLEGHSENDYLVELYASTNNIDKESAQGVVGNYIAELKDTIRREKSVRLPGLGKLRATRDNDIFFVPDENLGIYPQGFGLSPVSMKSHLPQESLVKPKPVVLPKPEPEPTPEPEPVKAESIEASPVSETPAPEPEPIPEKAQFSEPLAQEAEAPAPVESVEEDSAGETTEPTPVPSTVEYCEEDKAIRTPGSSGKVLRTVLIIIVVLMLILSAYILLAKFAPDFIDSILYTAEERAILNYPL